mgnify:CR=1 FL=1
MILLKLLLMNPFEIAACASEKLLNILRMTTEVRTKWLLKS